MQQKNEIRMIWPTFVGEFYNPDHDELKKKLLVFFEDYKRVLHFFCLLVLRHL